MNATRNIFVVSLQALAFANGRITIALRSQFVIRRSIVSFIGAIRFGVMHEINVLDTCVNTPALVAENRKTSERRTENSIFETFKRITRH